MDANPIATSAQTREQTRTVVSQYLQLLIAKDYDRWYGLWADDTVVEIPYAPQGFPRLIKGKSDAVGFFSQVFSLIKSIRFDHIQIEAFDDPERVMGRWSGDMELVNGKFYRNQYTVLFQVRGNRILRYVEHCDPVPIVESFGAMVGALERTK